MLAGNRGQDGFYESNSGGFSSDVLPKTKPKRNQNTRRAIKDTRTSEKALQGMGNNGGKLSEISFDSISGENSVKCSGNVKRGKEINSNSQIQLGDYCLPPDKKEETLGGIASSRTTEYADPYETKQMLEALRSRGGGPRFSAPVEDQFTYALAKPLEDNDHPSKSQKESFRHTYTEGSKQVCTSLSGTSVDSGVEDPDEYDHTVTWVTNGGKNRMAQVIPNPTSIQTEKHIIHEHSETKDPSSQTNPDAHKKDTKLYAAPYEDAWDTTDSQMKFDKIIDKAKKEYRKKSHSDDYEEPVSTSTSTPTSATYEEAWDLKPREQKLENTVQEAHRRMSEGQQNLSKRRDNYEYKEPWSMKGQPEPSSKVKNGNPEHPVYSEAYEDPWDIKQREKVKALEKRFNSAAISPKSPNSQDHMDVPSFPAPPPPNVQTYEETWDKNQFVNRTSHHSGNSPNQRRQSEGMRTSRTEMIAERINPDIPLDIQKFYHGKIGRKQAESLLLIHREGSYLVRRSETQDNVFSLSLKGVGGMPMHLRISLANGLYILGENSKPFPTVPEMIDHYTQCELPVLKADRIKLLHPVPRHS
ncbi:uncharacterized protein LOC143072997 isoform X1 [Mytilus galloprovincialis]|uniref:uncharacterized protein LOC143072997 isoform X1 n=1 Tax=Mytilus galloprovincialis TaxID=29158 RepID=UPI003F7B7324